MKSLGLIIVLIFIMSCATTERTRYREGDNTGQETSMTVQDEEKMAQEALKEMQKDYPPVKDEALQSYVSDLGMKLVKSNNLEGNPYHYSFTVVDVNYVNAFALPAGTVFVTAPLIAMAGTEAELAGVIGHEIGHVKARHTAERMEKAKKGQTKSILYTVGAGVIGGVVGYATGAALCKSGDTSCKLKGAVAGAAVGAGGALLIQKYQFMANSREDEMEADRIGFKVATHAGYSKDEVGLFYKKLLEMEKESKGSENPMLKSLADVMSTHPPSEERVKQMDEMTSSYNQTGNATVNTEDFKKAKIISAKYGKNK